ncbi:MAG TPA: hydrogen peroxide-dependent heme synthase [Terracidiphilus sp.]|nr:hydrogen peroxide-dependent heme synthase [Terracidiphilus sp.]
MSEFPPVPLTLEGSSVLHQFFRFDWKAWRRCAQDERAQIAGEAIAALKAMERDGDGHNGEGQGGEGKVQTALYSQLGHKGDLILIHFREGMEALNRVELELAQTRLYDFMELKHSYVSVVELGLYESTRKTYEAAAAKGFAAHTPEWEAEVAEAMKRGAEAMKARLFPAVPEAKFICFYPMDRPRGETKNWYTVPFAERQRMMHEHGLVGRRYGDRVKQIISGSIGMDDWEWGVTLFAEEPVVFKKLIYEMRFDEVSAVYALFGQFFLGIRLPLDRLGGWVEGKV